MNGKPPHVFRLAKRAIPVAVLAFVGGLGVTYATNSVQPLLYSVILMLLLGLSIVLAAIAKTMSSMLRLHEDTHE